MNVPATRAEAISVGATRYFTGVPCPKGHLSERSVSGSTCVECKAAASKCKSAERYQRWKARDPGRYARRLAEVQALRSGGRYRETEDNYRIKAQREKLVANARKRAKDRGLDFDISVEALDWPEICPALGVRIAYASKTVRGVQKYGPSLDRVDNAKGYVVGNVRVISLRANVLKRDATPDELMALAVYSARAKRVFGA